METEEVEGTSNAGPNKRQALADISNDMSHSHGGNSKRKTAGEEGKASISGAGVRPRSSTGKSSENPANLPSASKSTPGSAAESLSAIPFSKSVPDKSGLAASAGQASEGNAAVMASLERRTVNNLHISSASGSARDECLAESVSGSPEPPRQSWSCSLGYISIDNNPSDPQLCSDYVTDIYANLRAAELRRRPSSNFMETLQRDINSSMRGILVDWLVEVAEEYKLVPDTLYLTCSFIDRYLSANVVTRNRLQLLGVSSMLIAAKYEEIYAPQVEEFCYITDNTYRREEVLEMERKLLSVLHFDLSTPTIKSFLRRFIRAAQASFEVPSLRLEFLGNYLAELTLVDYPFLKYLPSLTAASAVFLAKLTLNNDTHPWTPTLQHYTGYRPSQLQECVTDLYALQLNVRGCGLPAIREKYGQPRFQSTALLTPPAELSLIFFEDFPTQPNTSLNNTMVAGRMDASL